MSFQPGANVYTQGFGSRPENVEVPHIDSRAPASSDTGGGLFTVGKRWINTAGNTDYTLTSLSTSNGTTTATWTLLGTNTGPLNTLTGDSGGAISPSSNNITLAGTAGQISTSGAGSTITFALANTMVAPGSLEVTGLLKGDAGATLNTAGTTMNIATDNDTATVNIALGTSARTVHIADSASANLVTIGSVTGVASLTLQAGTGNMLLTGATTTTYTVGTSTGTGTMTFGLSTAAQTINISNAASNTGASAVNILSGATPGANQTLTIMSGVATAGTQSIAILGGANANGSQSVAVFNGAIAGATDTINVFSGAIASGTCTYNLFNGNAAGGTLVANIFGSTAATTAGTVNIGTGAAAHVLNLGSTTAGAMTIRSGTSISIGGGAASTITIGAAAQTGAITIGNSTAALTVALLNGVAASAQTLNIASGTSSTAAQTVNLLNGTTPGASTTLNIMNGAATAGTQAVKILSTGATRAGTYNIGDGAAAHVGVIGSTTASASLTLQAGSGATGLSLSAGGNVQMAPVTNSAAGVAVTVNGRVFQATFTGQTTASGSSQVFTITNSAITGTTQAIIVSADNLGSNDAQMTITRVLQSASTLAVTLKNNGAAALNGDVHITGWILN